MMLFTLVSFILQFRLSWLYYPLALLLICSPLYSHAFDVVFAVNCGGPKHVDQFGVHYIADTNSVGTASEFGRSLSISRVHPNDMILYQTERYHYSSFIYDIPIEEDGDYVLVTKYSEVYFQQPGAKVFDVKLNRQHVVISNLDIFSKVGKAAAYDAISRFQIEDGQLFIEGESSNFNGKLLVEFSKGNQDNPKVNAIVLLKGPLKDTEIPALPSPSREELFPNDSEGEEIQETEEEEKKFDRASGPRTKDPYASDDSWFMPITIAVAVFLPVLFCLCRVR